MGALPAEELELMKLSSDPRDTVRDIAAGVTGALRLGGRNAGALRRAAVESYDWRSASRALARELGSVAEAARGPS